ncbi:uncharacterized protein LOC128725891 [Anopheles nili]|uniref:uncharacterized protein LOC128725891 n=1 Tax=Anopheles nili TaxID=185578 RepID=UPI00237ABC39|nr:uncharacterized protein LOC128725891 [Anopheles nili]
MIDQQPKLSYFPIDTRCSGGPPEPDTAGSLSNENTPTQHPPPTVSGSAKTPITTPGATPSSLSPPSAHRPYPAGSTVSSPTLAEGQRLLLAAVMTGPGEGGTRPGDTEPAGHLAGSLCGQCCGPICDRYIMKVVDITYHERCLQCTSCSIRLMHSCFMRDGKLYCRFDYERLYGRNRCLGCGEKIGADELVMRALDNVFHLKCFICVVCGARLQKGDQYVIKQSQLFCRPDYEKEVEMFQGYSYDEYCCEDMFQTRIDGRRGPKRPRTILTTQQRRAFKASFDISPKPCRKIREGLAKDTGLSIRIVQVWFQNQRAKMKKIQKKQLKDGGKSSHHGSGSSGGSGNSHTGTKNHNGSSTKGNDSQEELSDNESAVGGKLSLRIKDENSRSNNYLHDSCSDNEGTVTDNDGGPYGGTAARLGLGGSDPYKIVKEELDLEDDYFRMAMSTPNHHHHHQQQQQQQQFQPNPNQHNQHNHHHHLQTPGGGRFGGKSFASEHHANAGIKTENMALDSGSLLTSGNNGLDYGVSLQQLASSLNGGNPGGGTGCHGGPESLGAPMLNPIDRLYSMQSSYFCNQDSPLIPPCPASSTGHATGTPPTGNHQRPAPGTAGPPLQQHHGIQSMAPHHFAPGASGMGGGLGASNVGMAQHIGGMCNAMIEQQQQQQQESVM